MTTRELAELIAEGREAWVDTDAVTVANAYLRLRLRLEAEAALWDEQGHIYYARRTRNLARGVSNLAETAEPPAA